jgi:hypothetical protein
VGEIDRGAGTVVLAGRVHGCGVEAAPVLGERTWSPTFAPCSRIAAVASGETAGSPPSARSRRRPFPSARTTKIPRPAAVAAPRAKMIAFAGAQVGADSVSG